MLKRTSHRSRPPVTLAAGGVHRPEAAATARRPDQLNLPDDVRWERVALARKRLAAGAYEDPAVLNQAIDKLLAQFR